MSEKYSTSRWMFEKAMKGYNENRAGIFSEILKVLNLGGGIKRSFMFDSLKQFHPNQLSRAINELLAEKRIQSYKVTGSNETMFALPGESPTTNTTKKSSHKNPEISLLEKKHLRQTAINQELAYIVSKIKQAGEVGISVSQIEGYLMGFYVNEAAITWETAYYKAQVIKRRLSQQPGVTFRKSKNKTIFVYENPADLTEH